MTGRRMAALATVAGAIALSAGFGLSARDAAGSVPEGAAPSRCEALAAMRLPGGSIVSAEPLRAGQAIATGVTAGTRVAADLCRVRLLMKPVPESRIAVEVWLPDRWNRRLMGFGGGGFDGSLNANSGAILNPAVAQGYAAVVTDVGHTPAPTPGSWIQGQPERVVDFGHRGVHLAAVAAKQALRAFYGRGQEAALFQGCSNGGRDAMMLVSRYPQDYDAVIAGAPALRYAEVVTQLAWYSRIAATAPRLSTKLALVHRAVLDQCDAIDGVADGVLENPRQCRFDPAALQCRPGGGGDCLDGAEVAALRAIYGGPRLADGTRIYHGPALGSEGVPDNWTAWITGPVPGLAGEEFYRWMVHDDPAWTAARFDLDRDYALARRRVAPVINADDPDIRAFVRRGGRLLIYQGWDDPAITPDGTIAHFDAMRARVGAARFDRQVRLFMVPGMAHCGGGPGATAFEMQPVLERWIATGTAPSRVIATKRDLPDGAPPLSHPLCAWPTTARHDGRGPPRDAASYACALPGGTDRQSASSRLSH